MPRHAPPPPAFVAPDPVDVSRVNPDRDSIIDETASNPALRSPAFLACGPGPSLGLRGAFLDFGDNCNPYDGWTLARASRFAR